MAYKVLVVDDEKAIVEHIKASLIKNGYEADVAFDGEEALAKVKTYDPDVIILDLVMPKMNGFDVLTKLRENTNDKWRPVLIVSANTELEALEKCYNLKADHYITKPYKLDDLLRGVQILISLISAHI